MDDELAKADRETSGSNIDPGTISRLVGSTSPSATVGGEWFGPGKTLNPVAPDSVAGRQFDFPTHYNVNLRPRSYDSVTFAQLRALADSYDLLRLAIETRKDQIESFAWEIVAEDGQEGFDNDIKAAYDFLKYPDKEHPWSVWLRMLLEDMFVIDAVTIYPRATRGGDLYSLDLMDGATVKRVIDEYGRTPIPPETAYQQVLKGLPAVDYTREELLYFMRNPRTNRVYGYSPVEQIIMTVNIALRRQLYQLNFYTEGNIPEAICGMPEDWSLDTIKQFQVWWDSMMEGNLSKRRHMTFVPFDPSKMSYSKQEAMKDQYDEWLARIICFAFSISPTMLVKETNRATADTVAETAKNEGLVPLLNWIKTVIDYIIDKYMGLPHLEFKWQLEKSLDPKIQADVDAVYIDKEVLHPEEVRERLGLKPMDPKYREELKQKSQLRAMNPLGQPGGQQQQQETSDSQAAGEEALEVGSE
jgi:hypothetical protein